MYEVYIEEFSTTFLCHYIRPINMFCENTMKREKDDFFLLLLIMVTSLLNDGGGNDDDVVV